jgi:hypothetical protein
MLERFFAVTAVANAVIFEVKVRGDNGDPCIGQLEGRPLNSKRKKKKTARNIEMRGQFLVIAKWLQLFGLRDSRHGFLIRLWRKAESLPWMGGTPPVVALFLTEEKARECFKSSHLKENDPHWRKYTKEVMAAIGKKHPIFIICRGRWKNWKNKALVY